MPRIGGTRGNGGSDTTTRAARGERSRRSTSTSSTSATRRTQARDVDSVDDQEPVPTRVTQVNERKPREPTADELKALARGVHADPHTILGAHVAADGKTTKVRATLASLAVHGAVDASDVVLVVPTEGKLNARGLRLAASEERIPMKLGAHGLLEAKTTSLSPGAAYSFEVKGKRVDDPYRFSPTLNDNDVYLFKQGTLEDTSRLLGSHAMNVNGVDGYNFVVWAPNARGVSVVGDFNDWDPAAAPMRKLGNSLYEVFLPGVKENASYMFSVATSTGKREMKSDPAARATELRPDVASKTTSASTHVWNDDLWMHLRATKDPLAQPVSTYEVHLASWKRNDDGSMKNYRQLADELVPHLKEHGFNAIELVGLAEHPLDDSWGYQVTGYYAPTSRHGSPEDFKYFVDKLHQAGVRVMYDWVPAHYPKDKHGLAEFDGTHLFDHEDDRLGEHLDWGTRIFNYDRPEVKSFLVGGLVHMLEEYHLDGIRVDAVASMLYRDYSRTDWIPNKDGGNHNLEAIAFLQDVNARVGKRFPGVLRIAEESTAFPGVTTKVEDGGLGFDLKWNMGWMHDTLEFFKTHPNDRANAMDSLTNTFLWAHSEKFVAALSHDEVVHLKRSLLEKMPGDEWQRFANLRLLFGWMFAYPGQKLLFMGSELAQSKEWDFKSQLDWQRENQEKPAGVAKLLADLNKLYISEPALTEKQFDPSGNELFLRDTKNAVVGMVRHGKRADDDLVFLHNLTEKPRQMRVGVDRPGTYRELINTDDVKYGGSGLVNGDVVAEPIAADGKKYSLTITLPPLGTMALKRA